MAGKPVTITEFCKKLHAYFNMEGGGELCWYLGIKFSKEFGKRTLDQTQYVEQKLNLFNNFSGHPKLKKSSPLPDNVQQLLIEAKSSTEYEQNFPFRQIVGGLMYAMVGTRLDICYVSQFLHCPNKINCDLVRHIYQYLVLIQTLE